MLDFTWEFFMETGNVDTYLLCKELEKEKQEIPESDEQQLANIDLPVS